MKIRITFSGNKNWKHFLVNNRPTTDGVPDKLTMKFQKGTKRYSEEIWDK